MKANRITICNLYGTKEITFQPATITALLGKNESGKSSVLEAIQDFFAGGSKPSSIRNGCEKGWIRFELEGAEPVVAVQRTQYKTKSDLVMLDDAGRDISKAPATFVKEMADALAIDPGKIVMYRGKDLVPLLLKIMPLDFTPEEISETLGEAKEALRSRTSPALPSAKVNLDELDAFRKQIFEERTRLNTLAEDADGTVKNLRQTLPQDGEDVNWVELHAARAGEVEALKLALASTIAEIDTEEKRTLCSIDEKMTEDIKAIQTRSETSRATVRLQATQFRNEERDKQQPVIDNKNAEVAVAKERADTSQRLETVRTQIDSAKAKSSQMALASQKLTMAISAIDNLKKRRLEALPIPNMSFRDGSVYYKEVPWEQVNTARRVELSFAICTLLRGEQGGKLGFMIMDSSESMDNETWLLFQQGARNSGYQVICARVGPGPLSIELMNSDGTWKKAPAVNEPKSAFQLTEPAPKTRGRGKSGDADTY